jgi:hypothetical protein
MRIDAALKDAQNARSQIFQHRMQTTSTRCAVGGLDVHELYRGASVTTDGAGGREGGRDEERSGEVFGTIARQPNVFTRLACSG